MLILLGIGLALGLRHVFEPDHLAAVTTLASRPGARLWSAGRLGLVWGVGHTVTVGVVALIIIALDIRLPPALWPAAELLVAVLLVLLGALVIWRYARGRWHIHPHSHPSTGTAPHLHLHSHAHAADHVHAHATIDARRSLGFGVAHGLAGSGAIVALLVAAAPDTASRVVYFAAFGAGTIIGMFAVSLALSLIVRLAADRGRRWATILHLGAATLSMVAGVALAGQVVFRGS